MQNSFENIQNLGQMNFGSIPVQTSNFDKMQLSINNSNNNNNSNNLLNINPINDNAIIKQIDEFNKNNSPNMKINLNQQNSNEQISVQQAQKQNKNMMKCLADAYIFGDSLIFNSEYKWWNVLTKLLINYWFLQIEK